MEDVIYDEALDGLDVETTTIPNVEEENLYVGEDNNCSDNDCGLPPSDVECPIDDPEPEWEPFPGQELIYYQEIDRNGDGQTDMIYMEEDTDGDGIVDVETTLKDNNFDGEFESREVCSDENGDGYFDTNIWESDENGDGVVDSTGIIVDSNGNGFFDDEDSYDISYDSNNTGIIDTHKMQIDTDGDGLIDYAEQGRDYNNDEVFDSVKIYEDTTGSGVIDTMTELYDSTGDGKLDMAEIHHDYDEDGIEDWTQICQYDPKTGNIIPLNDPPEYASISATYSWELPQYEPSDNYPEGVCGDPASSMQYWEHQGESGPCALYSQMFIIEEFTGQDIDINEFTAIAESNGWYGTGTAPLNMSKMLDAYGIDNEMSFHNDMDDIEDCLNEGGRVIVAIDADEIWSGEGGDLFSPNAAANHAVEVIGIDYSNPEHPMVILNDSGSPTGRGEMVPLDDFVDAWKDSECQMIKCYPNK